MKVIPLQCLCQVSMLMIERGNTLFAVKPITSKVTKPTKKIPKTNKKETMIERRNPLFADSGRAKFWNGCKNSEKNWWIIKLLNTETHTPVLLMKYLQSPHARDVRIWGKHSVYTHFSKDRDCEICQGTKITRAPCRRRFGGAVPRAENFGDLITADQKVHSDNCESRNNHRYAVVVQDLATQWIQSYPCKKQNFTGSSEKLAKVPGTREET